VTISPSVRLTATSGGYGSASLALPGPRRGRSRAPSTLICLSMLSLTMATAALPDDAPVAARVGDRIITDKEVAERAANRLSALRSQEEQIKRQALQELVDEQLLYLEAQRRETTVPAVLEQEVTSRVPVISPAETRAIWDLALPQYKSLDEQEGLSKIRADLTRTRSTSLRRALLQRLRTDFGVELSGASAPKRLAIASSGPTRGPSGAPVTLVEFSDFQCPYCFRARETLRQVAERFGDSVRMIFKHLPLDIHPDARAAAEAAVCAEEQGKFWPMHDALFEDVRALSPKEIARKATRVGLDSARLDECLSSGRAATTIEADIKEAGLLGARGTPTFFVNGRMHVGSNSEALMRLIDEELAGRKPAVVNTKGGGRSQ
jgi:protein-disulfide isomerase